MAFAANVVQILQVAGAVVAIVVGLAGLVGVLWCLGQMSALRASLDSLSTTNAELRAELADARIKLDAERRDCVEKIANIQGQLTALTSSLANQIVTAVVQAMATMVHGGPQ